jgi:hypothetical protein
VNEDEMIQELPLYNGLILHFRSSGPDSFVIILKRDRQSINKIAVEIFIPEKDQSADQLYYVLEEKYRQDSGSNRVSGRMKSGRSVSGALRTRTVSSRRFAYVLDISIDLDGKLRWPDLSDLTQLRGELL